MKPVILVTVYRRYIELARNLEHIHQLKHEFREPLSVVVVWANPEVGRLWFMNRLIEQGKIDCIVGRPALSDEFSGQPSTYPESHNLRAGLEHIRKNFEDYYVIGQAADIQPLPGAYRFVDNKIHEGERAVLYYWENNCCREDVWHTNFFAVTSEEYWPPISSANNHDVLERQWGLLLAKTKPERIFRWHNSRNQSFLHDHVSELEPEIDTIPVNGSASVCLSIKGYKSIRTRIYEFLKRQEERWRKLLSYLIPTRKR